MRLGDFLRRSLTLGSRDTIPLAEELDLAVQLLEIEKVRFGARLGHELRADDAARACAVPPLVLQPVVENAITHGIAQMLEGGTVRITATKDGPELLIAVENPRDPDSPGRKGAGIGLQNVKRRLAALHGTAAEVVGRADADRVPGRAALAGEPLSRPVLIAAIGYGSRLPSRERSISSRLISPGSITTVFVERLEVGVLQHHDVRARRPASVVSSASCRQPGRRP